MKKRSLMFLVLTIVAPSTFGRTATVHAPGDGFLALRSEPSSQSGVRLAKIPHGTELTLGECRLTSSAGAWCKTAYQGKNGWILEQHVIEQDQGKIGTWRISSDGFGPITVGMPKSEASKLLGRKLNYNSSWTDDCFFANIPLPNGVVSFQVKDQRIVRVSVSPEGDLVKCDVVTSKGIRIGDSLAKVDKAYRTLSHLERRIDRGFEGDRPALVYWDPTAKRGILFEYDSHNRVTGISAGTESIFSRHEGCE